MVPALEAPGEYFWKGLHLQSELFYNSVNCRKLIVKQIILVHRNANVFVWWVQLLIVLANYQHS